MALAPLALQAQEPLKLSPNAVAQIAALQQEKASWTPTQRKVDSKLLLETKRSLNQPTVAGIPLLRRTVKIDPDGRTKIDIKAKVTKALLQRIETLGGTVINSFPRYNAIQADVPVSQVQALASESDVAFVREAIPPLLNKTNTSEGDIAHAANTARATFGVDGTGVKVGVLSDSASAGRLAALKASGDLPDVTVLSAGSGTNEGAAMLEIVYDLAPGAQLYFATAFGGQAAFATNIQALATAGCNVIVDDVGYLDESVFQDSIIAQAVDTVAASGVAYFSSAANSGNLDDGTAGVWEGDFLAIAAPPVIGGTAHDFGGGVNNNTITVDSPSYFTLQWSDPSGGSSNDYNLYLLDSSLTTVWDASLNAQTGSQDPLEYIDSSSYNDTGNKLVIIRSSGADRYLHLNANRGRLSISTAGQTWGHSCANGAFGVAAVDAKTAHGAGGVFNATETIETFSSDGPRRVFYNSAGAAYTPGNFSSTGGQLRQKPDLTAADGVSCATPGFSDFHGTSAAAPHAAAIAALLIDQGWATTPASIRQTFVNTALDIEAAGWDRDSGMGIIMADAALAYAVPPTGSLRVTISPQGAIDAGAQWRRAGTETWFNSGNTESDLPTGDYTVEFVTITGWDPPENQDVTVANGETASASGIYTIKSYTLTYNAGAGGSISGTSPQNINHGANGTTVTAVPSTGYRFAQWSDGVITTTRRDTNVTIDLAVTATFLPTSALMLSAAVINLGTQGQAGNSLVHWGEAWSKSDFTMLSKSQCGHLNQNSGALYDQWAKYRSEGHIIFNSTWKSGIGKDIYQEGSPQYRQFPGSAPASGDYALALEQSIPSGTLAFPDFLSRYQDFKNLAQLHGRYYGTDASGAIYRDGIKDLVHKVADFNTEFGETDRVNTPYYLVFIDTTDGAPPRYGAGTNVASIIISGSGVGMKGMFYVCANFAQTGAGNPANLVVEKPDGSTTTLARVYLDGVIYSAGTINYGGNPVIFGSVITEKGFVGGGTPDVYYNYRLRSGIDLASVFRLTFEAGPGGSVSADAGVTTASSLRQMVSKGDDASAVLALPNTGYHFTKWTLGLGGADYSTDNPLTVTNVTETTTILAVFTINTYTLNVAAEHGTVAKSPERTTYEHGATVTLSATPDTDYAFSGWSGDVPAGHGADNPLVLAMNANKSIVAEFTFVPRLGVSVSPNTWHVGPRALGVVVESEAFVTSNTGNVAEDFAIRGADGAGGWLLQGAPGLNAFRVDVDQDRNGSYDFALTKSEQALAEGVAISGARTFGLRYSAPTSDTLGAGVAQDFAITIKASRHNP